MFCFRKKSWIITRPININSYFRHQPLAFCLHSSHPPTLRPIKAASGLRLRRTSHLFPLECSCDVSGDWGLRPTIHDSLHPNTRRVHPDSGIFSVTFVTIRGGETKRIHMNMTCLFWFSKLLSHDKVEIKSIFNWSLFLSFVTGC